MIKEVRDITGDLIPVEELVKRLRYRQDKRRVHLNIPVNTELNISVCWNGHMRTGKSPVLDECDSCHGRGNNPEWKIMIREGRLIKG
jgi:hypothetical protein